jgi:hypothetical protein
MGRDIEHNPPNISERYLWWYAGLCLPTTWSRSPLKNCSSFVLQARWYGVCLCIHRVVQNTKQYPFLIHAGSVYTICVIILSFFLSFGWSAADWSRPSTNYSISSDIKRELFCCERYS